MSKENAHKTLWELMGTIEPHTHKGCIKIRMIPKLDNWGDRSMNEPYFYVWEGKLQVTAPKEILDKIILPIIQFAVSTGGVGRGWRRPLHIFHYRNNNRAATRGSHLIMKLPYRNSEGTLQTKPFSLRPNPETWNTTYEKWLASVQACWGDRINMNANQGLKAEVFSPRTCAVYAVPGPEANPIDENDFEWLETNARETRGEGMHLIYEQTPPRNYKLNPEIGGSAANAENSHCSWASIKRINIRSQEIEVDCQEIVCLFMGGKSPQENHIRSHFLKDLNTIEGKVHLFGVSP